MAGTQAGTAQVAAISGQAEGAGTVTLLAGPPAKLTLAVADASLPVDGRNTTDVRAAVVDTWGNKVANGIPVTFTVDVGSLSPEVTATTDGIATAVYTGTRRSALAEITAWTVGGAADTATIWLEPYRVWLPVVTK
jgi:hypothetical protein